MVTLPARSFNTGYMITIHFYNYLGHPNTVNKTLGQSTDIQGVLRSDFDMENPVLRIRYKGIPAFNYCYIPTLNRYYFIDNAQIQEGDAFILSLRVDVLKTYEREIMQARGTITERDNADTHINTRSLIYSTLPNFEKLEFPNTGLFSEEGSIIMVTIKGDK